MGRFIRRQYIDRLWIIWISTWGSPCDKQNQTDRQCTFFLIGRGRPLPHAPTEMPHFDTSFHPPSYALSICLLVWKIISMHNIHQSWLMLLKYRESCSLRMERVFSAFDFIATLPPTRGRTGHLNSLLTGPDFGGGRTTTLRLALNIGAIGSNGMELHEMPDFAVA